MSGKTLKELAMPRKPWINFFLVTSVGGRIVEEQWSGFTFPHAFQRRMAEPEPIFGEVRPSIMTYPPILDHTHVSAFLNWLKETYGSEVACYVFKKGAAPARFETM
jgi:hypothetical protein